MQRIAEFLPLDLVLMIGDFLAPTCEDTKAWFQTRVSKQLIQFTGDRRSANFISAWLTPGAGRWYGSHLLDQPTWVKHAFFFSLFATRLAKPGCPLMVLQIDLQDEKALIAQRKDHEEAEEWKYTSSPDLERSRFERFLM